MPGDGGAGAVGSLLDEGVEAGDFPGAVALAGDGDVVVLHCARGLAVREPQRHPATLDTVYDLAELTQPLVTAPLLLLLHVLEGVDLDSSVSRFVPEIDRLDKRDITLRHLLLHRSGLPEHLPLYVRGRSMGDYLGILRGCEPIEAPGTRDRPSAPGFLLAGEIAARVGAAPLGRLASELILDRLGAPTLRFGPLPQAERPSVAATEHGDGFERARAGRRAEAYRGWRQEMIWGEVHDHLAWTLGGVAGNAGLFGAARDVWRLVLEMLGRGRGLFPDRVQMLLRDEATPAQESGRSLGWRLARCGSSGGGSAVPAPALEADGFTGASIWIEPRSARVRVLLTNRVHPRVPSTGTRAARDRFLQMAVGNPDDS